MEKLGLNKNEMAEMKEAFSAFDEEARGAIGANDIKLVLGALGITASEKELDFIVRDMVGERKSESRIDFLAFCKYMSRQGKRPTHTLELWSRAAFDMFDSSKQGKLSDMDLQRLMNELGDGLSAEEANAMVKFADKDGDMLLSYEEFTAMMKTPEIKEEEEEEAVPDND